MAKSLQEQLLEAGAVDKNRAQKIKKKKHKQAKQRARGAGSEDAVKQSVRDAEAAKLAKDREISRAHQAALDEKAIAAQVRQLIDNNGIERDEGDSPYNFSDGGIVKTIRISAAQHQQVVNGRIAIARLDGGYALIAAKVASKIAERDPDSIIVQNTTDDEAFEGDDEYADYQIPDDLTW